MPKGMFTKGQKKAGYTPSLSNGWCTAHCKNCGEVPFEMIPRKVVTTWETLGNGDRKRTQTIHVDCLLCKTHTEKAYVDVIPAYYERSVP